MNSRRIFLPVLGVFLLGALGSLARATEVAPPFVIQGEEMEVARQTVASFDVEVKDVPQGADAILEFTAWYASPDPAGYYGTMRVLWNGEPLEDILDRPEEWTVTRGQNAPEKVRRLWGDHRWNVPVLPYPEIFQDKPGMVDYFISPDEVDVVRFRFRLPEVTAGIHNLTIRNTDIWDAHAYPTLMLKDIKIQWVAK